MKSRTRAFSLNLLLVAVLLAATAAVVPAPAAQVTGHTVTNENDSGPGSLREAITLANGDGGVYTDITFALSGCPCTITLLSALPEVTESLVISGPDADQLTISGDNAVRVFKVASGTSLTLENLTVADGYLEGSGTSGAGVYSEGTLTVTDCVFSGNRAIVGADHEGGGIHSEGSLSISGSTFVGNQAHSDTGLGGAVYVEGTAAVVNSTFYDNRTAPVAGWGFGSALFLRSGSLTLSHSTVYSNTAATGGPPTAAIFVSSGTATLKNTIVADNPGGNCYSLSVGGIVDGGGNLQNGDSTCGATVPTGDPKLGPLADNGGPTPTMALPLHSPAVDACACIGVAADQRGKPRPIDIMSVDDEGGPCDAGAYEAWTRLYLPTVLIPAY